VLRQAKSREVSTPSSLLRPRNHNHHPFDAKQFLKSLEAEPTKQGPVLFPNDAPPPPRPPLIVTSRPLVESIARSELGQSANNTETSQSQINGQRVSFVPYLTRVKDYRNKQLCLLFTRRCQITLNKSSGSATNGEYRVRLPDGRMQIVSYTADENGYNADVRYDDEDKTEGNRIDNYQHHRHNDYTQHNDHIDINNNQYVGRNSNNNAYEDRNNNAYVTSNNNAYVNRNNNLYFRNNNVDYTDRTLKNDYVEKKEIKPVSEREDYYHYPDVSKEYYSDYSSEFNSNYEPHRSKFSTFINNENVDATKGTVSTVKPSYEDLKDLFVTKNIYNTQQNYDPVGIKVPSTTPLPYDGTTERVVVIGTKSPNLYTNIRNSVPNVIPNYASPRVVLASTPSSYLVSTIASLRNKVHLATKPILSDRFIDKINKYLSFN
ncbi:putative cuticle protein, partial [Operophtera brumata]